MFGVIGYALGKTVAKIPPPTIRQLQAEELQSPSIFPAIEKLELKSQLLPRDGVILSASALSRNLIYPIGLSEPSSLPLLTRPAETFDYFDQFLSFSDVSDNLFKPLKADSPSGKHYAAGGPRIISETSLYDEETPQQRTRRRTPKAYRETKTPTGTMRQLLTIWDIILPMLQPPLNFDFPEELPLPSELYNFQKTGVSFLLNNAGALLGDEMGTGKTVITTVAMRVLFRKGLIQRALVVCPKTILSVWAEHIPDWTALELTQVGGTRERRVTDWRYPAHVYLITYDTLRSDALGDSAILTEDDRAKFDLVVLDEAHNIKNPESGRSRAVKLFQPKYRWTLTGTPIQNSLDDLVAIFEFVKPNFLRSEGLSPRRAKELIQPYFRRVEKKDVFKELPPKVREEQWLELDDEQLTEYKATEEREISAIREKGDAVTKVHIFAVIQKLKQICNFAQNKARSPKSEFLMDVAEEIVASGKKLLVFTQYRGQGVEKLEELLKPFGFVTITGSTSSSQRTDAIRKFRNDQDTHVFLATVKAGGEGINLTEASYVIHFDHWWNPAVMWQAEDRAHRRGQQETVNIYSLWMRDTIDERIHEILKRKGLLHQEIVAGLSVGEIDKRISTEEWLEVLRIKPKGEAAKEEVLEKPKKSVNEVLARLEECEPLRFEQIIKELFRKLGYPNARTTKQAHDGGVDIIASKRAVGGQERIVVQCKRRTATVGEEVARDLLGVLTADRSISKGFLVVSGEVSAKCRAFCDRDGRLAYLSGIEVAKYLIQFGIEV